jgi:hypothetical protein
MAMTPEDLIFIESETGIRLPEDYKKIALRYRPDAGTDDAPIFDNAKAIINLNQKYHAGFAGMDPWPRHYFFIGDDGAASCYALDLSSNPPKVIFLDHGNPKQVRIEAESFSDYVGQVLKEIDQRPIPLPMTRSQRVKAALLVILGFVILILMILGFIQQVRKDINR